ncbi:MAG: ATP-dependent DNA helicase RecG [Oceanobacter sp.]
MSDLTQLKGVGPKLRDQLLKLDIRSQADLLFHLPFRYEDRSRIQPIGSLQHQQSAVVEGDIRAADLVFGRRRSLLVKIQDHTGTLNIRFYHFNASQKQRLKAGARIRCYGEARRGASGLELYHPEYQLIDLDNPPAVEDCLTPVYPATEGISQQRLRLLMEQVLERLRKQQINLTDYLPASWVANWQLPTLQDALLLLHQPPAGLQTEHLLDGKHPARCRLILEELLAHQLSMQRIRTQAQANPAPAVVSRQELAGKLLKQLPFVPTGAQQRVVADIRADLKQSWPMLRLVQGDVGSGKTLVAALAACDVLESGHQVALMAPTEILAEQHLNNFRQWLEPLGIKTGWLAGKTRSKARRETLEQLKSGDIQLLIGTHALFQDEVEFAGLGLVIVDEQHRFGVHQRLSLKEKGQHTGLTPHQLIMTATPIPRTLAMSAYADLDTSVIDELPPGRKPIETIALSDARRDEIIERVNAACLSGAQAYWVCTLIEESETLQCQAAEDTATQLSEALPDLKVGLVHGRMKAAEKAAVMDAFKQHELDLLVATTVIEVGVDVPNASLMIIENPERLGLAQLHQLRGRVGRGSAASHCVLLYKSPLGMNSKQRIQVMRESQDGFYIAEQDLMLRGPGEMLGTRQTGLQLLRIADLQRDAEWIPQARDMALEVWSQYPESVEPLIWRWLGNAERFAAV